MSTARRPRADDLDESWSMPPGESIYTHAPEPQSMTMGSAYQRPTEKTGRWPKRRRIGFRAPGEKR